MPWGTLPQGLETIRCRHLLVPLPIPIVLIASSYSSFSSSISVKGFLCGNLVQSSRGTSLHFLVLFLGFRPIFQACNI